LDGKFHQKSFALQKIDRIPWEGYLGLKKTTPGVFFSKQIPFWSPEIAQRQVPLKKDREEAEAQIGTAVRWGWIMMDHHPRPGVGSPRISLRFPKS
jgi:hypothetical protein